MGLREGVHRQLIIFFFITWCLPCWALAGDAAEAPAASGKPPLTAEEIVSNLVEKNAERARALQGYQCMRVYRLDYKGFFGKRQAEMVVKATYRAPATKDFTVVSQSGSKLIIDRVLRKLLESEKEALEEENREKAALTPQNYRFSLVGYDDKPGEPAYLLAIEPTSKNKFLYRGTIWVNVNDFAVARIEAQPANNPSFWTRKNEIEHTYLKVGGFWLPSQNRTVTTIRLGGQALLTIDYTDYQVEGPFPGTATRFGRRPLRRSHEGRSDRSHRALLPASAKF